VGSLSMPSRARCCYGLVREPMCLISLFFFSPFFSSERKKERTRSRGPNRRESRIRGCLLVGGAHKTAEETRKKGTNRRLHGSILAVGTGQGRCREQIPVSILGPWHSARRGCSRHAGWHLIKLGRRRSKLTLQTAACCLAGACDGWAAGRAERQRGSVGGMELILRCVHGFGRSDLGLTDGARPDGPTLLLLHSSTAPRAFQP
jgi:hypothetical protein